MRYTGIPNSYFLYRLAFGEGSTAWPLTVGWAREALVCALALALGLADVVQAEAGGMRIEALFVDEGFGSLDEETLEEVMDVLDGLREGGRVVGLVSHVTELRQRIPAQVRVTMDPAGSTLTVLGC